MAKKKTDESILSRVFRLRFITPTAFDSAPTLAQKVRWLFKALEGYGEAFEELEARVKALEDAE